MNKKRDYESLFPGMTIGVMGSAGGKLGAKALQAIHRLGATIARRGYVLITGACPGIPHEAVKGAKEEGGIVVGVSLPDARQASRHRVANSRSMSDSPITTRTPRFIRPEESGPRMREVALTCSSVRLEYDPSVHTTRPLLRLTGLRRWITGVARGRGPRCLITSRIESHASPTAAERLPSLRMPL